MKGLSLCSFFSIAAARNKGKNRKAAQPSTSAQTQVATDSLRDLDERLSALERDNIELKRDNVELKRANVELKRANVELKRANVELKTTVDRVSILKLFHSLRIHISSPALDID
jgi:predicted RNase H-like nuclease (RuvC/YqgF family)